ncbi:MAG TPA: HAMP domain-containing sensor histidine kinase [Acidimicrobiales bacterium]|nr:HAMP domain-containing sensor histidine kinase [Acidimicrobiales bacterium]
MPAGDDASDLDRRIAEVELLQRRVLNVIPHALRTPVTTLRGLAEAMTEASEAEIRSSIGPALRRVAAQVEHLLDDLLIASGYRTALPTGAVQSTPVMETLRTVWSEVGGEGPFEVVGPEDAAAMAPDGALAKMLVHVLDNAAKYGVGAPRAEVTLAGGRVRIAVRSAGPVPADLDILVEPFFREESAVMRSSGLGLGLTVTDALARQSGGSLSVLEAEGGSGLVTCLDLQAAPS